MKWKAFVYNNEIHSVSHLDPFNFKHIAEASKKRPERTYNFHVDFSMHCFTRSPRLGERVEEALWYKGIKEKRVFCFNRYSLSHSLRGIIRKLGEHPCWHTHHGNFFTIELVTVDGRRIEYEVYFDVTRATRKGWLNLIVQTGYERTDDYLTTQPKKRKISLDVIAYNTQTKKKIKRGR